MSLFDGEQEGPSGPLRTAPLAERMRPHSLDELSGQEHLVGPGKPLRVQIERDDSGSMILWGPPGVGKTTLAKIIAQATQATFIEFSAVMSGIKEIKQVMVAAALLKKTVRPTDAQIDSAMAGNICRCGTYEKIRAGVHRAAELAAGGAKKGGA